MKKIGKLMSLMTLILAHRIMIAERDNSFILKLKGKPKTTRANEKRPLA